MKSVNLLPREIICRDELNKFAIKITVLWAVIFLCLILFVLYLNRSIETINDSLEVYTALLSDEKYVESDLLAESLRGVRTDVSEFIEKNQIDLGIIAFVSESIIKAQTGNGGSGFLYIEEFLYEYGRLEITGVASDRSLISAFTLILHDENIFSDIEIPSITRVGGTNSFKLNLTLSDNYIFERTQALTEDIY